MDTVNIEDKQGRLIKAGVAFIRAPLVGDWVAAGSRWQQVTAVLHKWQNNLPVLAIRIEPPTQQELVDTSSVGDDHVPFPF